MGGFEKLAEDLGNLRYDKLALFLQLLQKKVQIDAQKDKGRGRKKLAVQLNAAATALGIASDQITNAWVTSKPFMKTDGSC